jgi:hypothetical protein
LTSYRKIETRRCEMDPISYGETIALHLEELRRQAAIERTIRRTHRIGSTPGWRIAAGRFLVGVGERVAGCAELARGEVEPIVKVLG